MIRSEVGDGNAADDHEEKDEWLRLAADRFGTPAFVYFTADIEQRIEALRAAFKRRFDLSFAVKSNPNPSLLHWLRAQVDGLDVSSLGEFRLALEAGWDPARISFTGPAKRDFELSETIRAGLGQLVVESIEEARSANAIAASAGRIQSVLLRIAPDRVPRGFGDHMAGRPCPFGIDVEEAVDAVAQVLRLPFLTLAGFHIFSGTQSLSADAISDNARIFADIFTQLCTRFDLAPEMLVFGSGFGIAYHDQDTPLPLATTAREILPQLAELRRRPLMKDTRLTLELGRFLVGEAGYFLTRVVSAKESRGTRFAICDGGMNNHLPASGHFGMVIRRNFIMHKVGGGTGPTERVDVVGPLCTSIDKLGSAVELPRLERGDILAIHNSGAYGLTASPIHFISHAPPAELLVTSEGLVDVTRGFGSGPDARLAYASPERLTA